MKAPLPFQAPPAPQPLQRKKSLPDVQAIAPKHPDAMSREEVSMLGSARREELRRMADESERLRANPLLYLVSPQVKVCIVLYPLPLPSDLGDHILYIMVHSSIS